MTEYRFVVRHVRYWRGVIHKWSTVYRFTGSVSGSALAECVSSLHEMEQQINYPAPGGAGGGIWEVAVYNQASGGVPISVASYFDPETPGSWIPYLGGGWTSLTTALEGNAEVALQVRWQAGLSSSGKPVYFRKWYHAVPQLASGNTAPDVSAANKTSLQGAIDNYMAVIGGKGILLGNTSRLAAVQSDVESFFGNHQMPRGRRKSPTKISSNVVHLPPGLLIVPGSDGSLEG